MGWDQENEVKSEIRDREKTVNWNLNDHVVK